MRGPSEASDSLAGGLVEAVPGGPVVGASNLIGAELDSRYRIVRRIGEGGMGQVYEALQLNLDRPVAIKVLHVDLSRQPGLRTRFEREARALARINHDNVLHAYDHGLTADGRLYLVTELLHGQPLDAVLADAPNQRLPPLTGVQILGQIASALAEVHGFLVHRDVKPHNVMVSNVGGRLKVKLLDFGLVKPAQGSELTSNVIMGTPAYMSPEQITQETNLDARSDLYSLGATAFELLTGRPPFVSNTMIDTLTHHLHTPARRIDSVVPGAGFPPSLVELVDALLQKSPESRPQSAHDVHQQLSVVESQMSSAGWRSGSYQSPGAAHVTDVVRRTEAPEFTPRPESMPAVSWRARVVAGTALLGLAIAAVITLWSLPRTQVVSTPIEVDGPPEPSRSAIPSSQETAPPPPAEGRSKVDGSASQVEPVRRSRTASKPPQRTRPDARPGPRPKARPRRPAAKPVPVGPQPPSARRDSQTAPIGWVEVTGFTVSGSQPTVEVSRSGVVLGRGVRVRLELPPGAHRLLVGRPGDPRPRKRTVNVTAGETTQAKVLLD